MFWRIFFFFTVHCDIIIQYKPKNAHLVNLYLNSLCLLHVSNPRFHLQEDGYIGCIKMIGAVLKLIIFTSMVNRIINTSRNERVTLQVYDTYLQMFDVCTLRHTAHIEAIVQFLPYSAQQVRCDGLHSHGNSVLQIR